MPDRQVPSTNQWQDRVGDYYRFACYARAGDIFNVYVECVAVWLVFAVCTHKSILGVVKVVEKSLVEWYSGAQYGGKHHLVGYRVALCGAEWRGGAGSVVIQPS